MAAPPPLAQESVWTDKSKFEDAEAQYHAQLAKPSEQPVAVPEPQQPLQVSNQNDQGTVEVQPEPKPVAQETVTEQPPVASVVQDPQPVPEVVIADAPAPEAEQAPAPDVETPVVKTDEKPAEVCPHLEKKKDGAQDLQSLPDTNVKEKKQKKAKVSNVKEQVAEEAPQPEEQAVAKDSQAPPQQQASSKGEKKQKEKQTGKEKEKEKVQSEKGGKQKKQAKDKQVNKDEAVVDNVAAAASADPVAEAQTESRKKGKKKEEKQDGGEEKKVSQKTAKKGKHGDKVIESTPPVVEVAIKAKEEKADSSQKARTGTCNGKSSLTDEIARARLHIKSSLQSVDALPKAAKEQSPEFAGRLGKLEEENKKLNKVIDNLQGLISKLESRVSLLEGGAVKPTAVPAPAPASKPKEVKSASTEKKEEDDDDVDLFGASDEDDAEKERLHQERVKAYADKKSKKPALIAKSSVILDVKPWDDETDMKEMERLVREIQMEGLVWGASKLVPLAFGIHKLQICCVVEDEKVSIDELQERIQEIEQFVQSADVAAFNKV